MNSLVSYVVSTRSEHDAYSIVRGLKDFICLYSSDYRVVIAVEPIWGPGGAIV